MNPQIMSIRNANKFVNLPTPVGEGGLPPPAPAPLVTQLTFDSATLGNLSHSRSASSPVIPAFCPFRILAADTVVIPIPSPTKYTMFLALFVFSVFSLVTAFCRVS